MLVSGRPSELRGLPEVTPAGARRMEAECDAGVAAVMSRARALPYVEDVTIFGNALHLLIQGAVEPGRVERDLQEGTGARVRTRPIEPSLEDVFVRLTKLAAQEEAAAGRTAR
jgi:hypothetical protein